MPSSEYALSSLRVVLRSSAYNIRFDMLKSDSTKWAASKGFNGNSCYLVDMSLQRSLTTQLFALFREEFNQRRSNKLLKGPSPFEPPALSERRFPG